MAEIRRIEARDSVGQQHQAFWTNQPSLTGAHRIVDPVQTAVIAGAHVTIGPVGAERTVKVTLADYGSVLAAIEQWGLMRLLETELPASEPDWGPDSEPDNLVY